MTPPRNNKPQSGTSKQHPKAPKGGSKGGNSGGKTGKGK
jgi:hypothetical protein